jgi:3-oxoacyl-[acyl-carrier protein] reductase
LENKVCVITGATSGLGAAIARRFADEGALLILHGRDEERGREMVETLKAAPGGEPELVLGDIATEEANDALVERARERYGRIDVLVLNAGVFGGFGRFWKHSPEEFDWLVEVNVKAPWLGARAAVPLMGDGGSIIVNTSVCAFVMYPDETLYSMSKGAATTLVKGMANDLGDRGIRVNAIAPGPTTSGIARHFYDEYDDPGAQEKRFADAMALGRLGDEKEIAAATLFLASDDSTFVTGHSLLADGGTVTRSTDWSTATVSENGG